MNVLEVEALDEIELLEMLIQLPEAEVDRDKREVRAACASSGKFSWRYTI
ncbi:hypothetical protein [Streptomyces sp. MI02-7b]|nr:hypothetical protein [Streptomyces sp. MI02-7b]MDX3078075.1 hypothetical protein [Streptomyces sp. MI02-7b]